MSKGFASNYRIVLLAAGVLLCFGGIGTRLVFLHVIDSERLVRHIDQARRQITVEYARRGDIVDARGDVLATSSSMIQLGVDPQLLRPQDEARWPELAQLIGTPLPELKKTFAIRSRPAQETDLAAEDAELRWVKLRDEIPESLYDQISALGIKGVYGNRVYRRTYPHGQLAAHLIGYVNKADVPAAGLERFADFYLRGQNGWRESEKDGRQRELAQFRSREVPASDGYSVRLSIDSVIQNWAELELEEIAKQFNPTNAVIIVSDARDGFLLALANYPTFDLNKFNTAPMEVQKNYAITNQIDPGSTFKIVAASGALEEKLVTLATRFDCMQEVVEYRGKPRRLITDAPHVWDHPLSVTEIIAYSSNRGAAQLAMRMGEEKFYDYARAFGFGQHTGFPFGGEINGELHHPSKWSGIDITRIPAGYSISATPLQIHYGMGTIASGGELLRPQLIREVRDASGETVYRFGPIKTRRVISARTAEYMAMALSEVVRDGTAKRAAIPGYLVAGKTGTAQKLMRDANGKAYYSDRNHAASFTGFFPASAPRVVITVIVDDGKPPAGHSVAGGLMAAPSFKRIAEKLIPYMDIKPVPEAGRQLVVMEGGRR
jgi:cell division protein FtsI/penicillin-binding protein 2